MSLWPPGILSICAENLQGFSFAVGLCVSCGDFGIVSSICRVFIVFVVWDCNNFIIATFLFVCFRVGIISVLASV